MQSRQHVLRQSPGARKITFVLRSIVNPVPCFGYGAGDWVKFPLTTGRFGFDMKVGEWVAPYGKGETADFWVRREETNGVYRAILEFEGPFNGVYKQAQEHSTSFKSVYDADASHVFVQTMDIWTRDCSGKVPVRTQHVSDSEYLVIRSRSVVDADGHLTRCNYSKIYGAITASESLRFKTMVFNPEKNDTNLEFDRSRNLRKSSKGILLP